ncbi:uncharacterized protein DNG_01852 [Cephalotrichum gorgonifer]|uniref:Uncharacterized protein n=1 Tax=Cephalotrichum gorgonifer TaxID=2041049 RepID=A0AAE8MRH5_9PEZI|nr:uncharacterized protein DNG_01852 [Cephalotrichum gorgonifer]
MPSPDPDDPSLPATGASQESVGAPGATPNATTPRRKPAEGGTTPKSAPAAGARHRAASKPGEAPPPPTLLVDFLRGRPSPARLTAKKQRRASIDAVKAEIQLEMRQSAVRRLQQPGGVKDRVKTWQKANAAAMAKGDPAAAPSEPTDVAFDDEEMSVTEEDRVRIKMRKRRASAPKEAAKKLANSSGGTGTEPETPTPTPKRKTPPKKRVVSDDHWMDKKNKKASPPRPRKPAKGKSPQPGPTPLTMNFLQRTAGTAGNPPSSKKVRSWAKDVDNTAPEDSPGGLRQKARASKSGDFDEDVDSLIYNDDTGTNSHQSSSTYLSRPRRPAKSETELDDDGIRVTPMRVGDRRRRDAPPDTERGTSSVPSTRTDPPDDGIRVRPIPETSAGGVGLGRKESRQKKSRKPSRTLPSVSASLSLHDTSPYDLVHDKAHDTESHTESEVPTLDPQTPTRRKVSTSKPRMGQRSKTSVPTEVTDVTQTTQTTETTETTESTETTGTTEADSRPKMAGARSVGGTSVESSREPDEEARDGAKSLAEIPFGKSAFSELDLPLGADARNSSIKRKPQRNASFSATKVLKKVVTGGKKIIHETVDPPKTVANKPPSIETWLTHTVDPFVDGSSDPAPNPAQTRKSVEKEWAEESQGRQPPPGKTTPRKVSSRQEPTPAVSKNDEAITPKAMKEVSDVAKDEAKHPHEPAKKTPPSGGLKRKGATRSNASPVKPGAGRFFRDALKDAFKGQSANQLFTQTSYESREERKYKVDEDEDYRRYDDDYPPRRSMGSHQRSHSPDSYDSRDFEDDQTTSTSSLPELRRRPPTNGFHELSTIVSEESNSSYGDTLSTLSQTTITQTTALTGESELSRQSSQKSRSGLKRRLTKHSDLVSVLSAPGNASVPQGVRNSRSRPSVRRTRSKHGTITIDDLLHEFEDDEYLYSRELKTLVDGVIPVLLNYAASESADLLSVFGPNSPGRKVDAMSKAVVGMGISLEKLKNAHRRAPLADVHKLVSWLKTVVSIYRDYLNAWRLGFEDLVVNLAPASDIPDDDDSLLNALPRNADGDIVNEDGERVDVAHLLRRPIFRLKMMTSFVKGAHAILAMESTQDLVSLFEALQEHARKRHKEERARVIDEDAATTDTTRARDLRTLAPLDHIRIDPNLQVNAKDDFALSVSHSNGQRMECRVELIYRDKPSVPSHPGELLIRQTGSGRRSWLLFPPVPLTLVSARRSDIRGELVAMIRGTHNGRQWHELFWLSTDDDVQISEWLDMLGTNPIPPHVTDIKTTSTSPEPESPQQRSADVPVGGRPAEAGLSSPDRVPPSPPTDPRVSLPSRYRPRNWDRSPPAEVTELPTDDQSPPNTKAHELSQPLIPQIEVIEVQSSQGPNTTPYREDGAPPPPVHRTFVSKKNTLLLQPPSDTRVKRRTSSPLKHEYTPSDGSSESEISDESGSESESESESDIDSIDIPDTEVGFSIRKEPEVAPSSISEGPHIPDVSCSVISDDSITPSNSASQVGLGPNRPGTSQDGPRFVCAVSHWSDKKGAWKDLSKELCTIIVSPGRMEAFSLKATSDGKPLIGLDLTPLVLIRKSNALDFEVRTALMEHSKLLSIGGGTFRFRNTTQEECLSLYAAVHEARLKNEKYIKLENEARFKSFGERRPGTEGGDDGSSSSRRRSWFGRKNSYRASARAPARSHEDASTVPSTASASSFLRRFTGGVNMTFNIGRSSVEKQNQSRAGSVSFYTSSSSAGGSFPRSPSISINESGRGDPIITPENIPIRLHLLVSASKWEDYGNCRLQVRRPPEGWHQELRANHGLEKRITVTTDPKKKEEEPRVILDAVLGSGCFGTMGTRGIVCSVWEEMRDEFGRAGVIPQTNSPGGSVKKWCFQLGGVGNAGWLLALLHEEVVRA